MANSPQLKVMQGLILSKSA